MRWAGARYTQPGCEPEAVVSSGGDARLVFDCVLGEVAGGERIIVAGGQLLLCGCDPQT